MPGIKTETDAALRLRQAYSVAGPSQTMLAGTYAAIAAITEVQRLAVYENDTNSASVSRAPMADVAALATVYAP